MSFNANKRAKAEVTKVTLDGKSQFIDMCLPTYYVKNTSTNDLYGFEFNPCEFLEDFGIEVEFKEVIRNVDNEPKFYKRRVSMERIPMKRLKVKVIK